MAMNPHVTLPAMAVPPQYAAMFNFLASSRLHYFRTVLRLSTRQQKVLRIIVIDAEGELFLYSEDGELKRQLAIPAHIEHVWSDGQVVVIRIADDRDLVLDFHSSRNNLPEATHRRFITVLAAFLRRDVKLDKVSRAMEYTKMGQHSDGAAGGTEPESLTRKLTRTASKLLGKLSGSTADAGGSGTSPVRGADGPRHDEFAAASEGDTSAPEGSPSPHGASSPRDPSSPRASSLDPGSFNAGRRLPSLGSGLGTFHGRRKKYRPRDPNAASGDDWERLSLSEAQGGASAEDPSSPPPPPPLNLAHADSSDDEKQRPTRSQTRSPSMGPAGGHGHVLEVTPPTKLRPVEDTPPTPLQLGEVHVPPKSSSAYRSLHPAAGHHYPVQDDHDHSSAESEEPMPYDPAGVPGPPRRHSVGPAPASLRLAELQQPPEVGDTVRQLADAARLAGLRRGRDGAGEDDQESIPSEELEEMESHRAIGVLLQELRNDRVSSYLEGVVADMYCREKELETAVDAHRKRVADRKEDARRRRAQVDEQLRSAAERQRATDALSILVLAACRRSQLLLQHRVEQQQHADAYFHSRSVSMALKHRDPASASCNAQAVPCPLDLITVPPYLRQATAVAPDGAENAAVEDTRAPRSYAALFEPVLRPAEPRPALRPAAPESGQPQPRPPETANACASAGPQEVAGTGEWITETVFNEKLSQPYHVSVLEML